MILRPRADTVPAALEALYGSRSKPPKLVGKTERESVIEARKAHIEASKDPLDFKYDYDRYSQDEVKDALRRAFGGKCAYCESFYAKTQPMDVEHWRPKGEVHEDDGGKKPGYYWLAADWKNLLPSCIDCNRPRNQVDALDPGPDPEKPHTVRMGKANQFPVAGGRRLAGPDAPLDTEEPLLLDPSVDDPEAFLTYDERGVVLPRHAAGPDRARALASIRVYALNRTDLVTERLALRRIVDHRLQRLSRLADLRNRFAPEDSVDEKAVLRSALTDLMASEVDVLLAMKEGDQPYAGMVREMLREADPQL